MKLGTAMKSACMRAVELPNPADRRPTLLSNLERFEKKVNDLDDRCLEAMKQATSFEEALARIDDDGHAVLLLIDTVRDVERGIKTVDELYALAAELSN